MSVPMTIELLTVAKIVASLIKLVWARVKQQLASCSLASTPAR